MTWFAWRGQRLQLLVCVGVVAILATVVAITGAAAHSAHLALLHACGPGGTQAACNEASDRLSSVDQWRFAGYVALLVLPGVLGLVLGTPLVAREIEHGTNRLAWTQSIRRTRWLEIKLLLAGLVIVAIVGGLDLLTAQWGNWVGNGPRIAPEGFSVNGFVDVGYSLFAFMLGAALGSVIRRTGWAFAAGVPLFVGFRFWVMALRPHLAPLETTSAGAPHQVSGSVSGGFSSASQPPAGWIINSGYVPIGRNSPGPGQNWNTGLNKLYSSLGRCAGRNGQITNAGYQRCVTQLRLHWVTQYQPASHFWALQSAETAVFVGAGLVLCALTVLSVSHWRT
ncbi:MAG TPA: hypothetical protein VEH29_05865 [Acidimicrobiales bacterium]|nr:hypothetical protein [Acidimicrobiales bacterium]